MVLFILSAACNIVCRFYKECAYVTLETCINYNAHLDIRSNFFSKVYMCMYKTHLLSLDIHALIFCMILLLTILLSYFQ